MPFYRIIKEKTATFIQSPENFEKIKIENLPKILLFQVIGHRTIYHVLLRLNYVWKKLLNF